MATPKKRPDDLPEATLPPARKTSGKKKRPTGRVKSANVRDHYKPRG